VSVLQRNLEILGFASLKLLHQEEDQMRRSKSSIMGLAVMLCLGLAAPWAMAGDSPLANATVSFGQWQAGPGPGPTPGSSVPELDRFPNLSPRD
jgi:hypothetical protein